MLVKNERAEEEQAEFEEILRIKPGINLGQVPRESYAMGAPGFPCDSTL